MKANELRIGNYINNEQRTEFVRAVDNWRIQCHLLTDKKQETLYEVSIHLIKPIPLTEQWLVDFGFDKNINKNQIDSIEMKLSIDNNKTIFSSCGTLDGGMVVLCLCAGNYFSNNLKYVHQLQNLYFALTGKELKKIS